MSLSDQIKQPGQIIGSGGGGGGTTDAGDLTTGQVALARGGTNADLSNTGGSGHVLKQSSAGAAITVGALTASDIPSTLNATTFDGITLLEAKGVRGGSGSSYTYLAGGPGVSQSIGAISFLYGNAHGSNPGDALHYCGSASGAAHSWFDKNGAEQLRVDENGVYTPYFQALLGIHTGGSNYELKLSGGVGGGGIGNASAGAQYHVENSAYPYAHLTWAPLRTRAASTAIPLCPVATGDMAYVTILESSIASCKVKVDTAGTVTFTDLDGNAASASIVNSSSPAAAEYGVYISAGVLYFKGGSSYAGKMSSFSQIGKA